MPLKDKIKIDSFKVQKMSRNDIKDVLKLAVSAQSNFGLTDKKAPSLFFRDVGGMIQNNLDYSFVYKTSGNRIFGAFILKPQTSISAEFLLAVSDPNVIQTEAMYEAFYNYIKLMEFKIFNAKVYKKRKKFQAYLRFLNVYGFTETASEDEDFLTLSLKKP